MIRRDYILRMIEELRRMLEVVIALKAERRWAQVTGTVDEQFQRLLGLTGVEAIRLTETELLARLLQGEASAFMREKTLFLVTLCKEAGEAADAQGRAEEGRAFHLKGLHLLLATSQEEEPLDAPDFVPRLDALVAALPADSLPLPTRLLLMHHYERIGAFAKAEDALFALLDAEPNHGGLLDLGIAFYERLRRKTAAELAAGNLPVEEVEAGLAELRQRQTTARPR